MQVQDKFAWQYMFYQYLFFINQYILQVKEMVRDRKKLGDFLLEEGLITEEELINAFSRQQETRQSLGKVLVEEGYLGEDTLLEAMEKQLGLPRINLQNLKVDPEVATSIPLEMTRRYQVIPVGREGNLLSLAMVDPQNLAALDEVERVTGCQVKPFIAGEGTIERLTDQYFGIKESVEWAQRDKNFFHLPENTTEGFKVREGMEDAPIIKVVNSIIQQAVSEGASDIHIDPYEEGLVVRLRIDGVLHDLMSTPKNTQPLIISRVKIAAGLDISEKRLPQDGRMVFPLEGTSVNMRISTLPTVFGEKVVLRILDREKIVLPLENLGFSDYNYSLFLRFIKASTGMILVTGPTGCGKSTTLYSTLNHLSSREKNIITVEDPVEYYLEGINQVQINGRIGYTFARALRTILRQDPNIVMIGEIRDLETAEIAVRAALTGHLVCSTLHTNDASRAVTRLLDMGIENYLLASSLIGVVAQRLVRKICTSCQEEYQPSREEKEIFNLYYRGKKTPVFLKGKGCSRCNQTGYKGRFALHEIMAFTDKIKELILGAPSQGELTRQAQEEGFLSLQEEGMDRVARGLTTISEVVRVVFESV